MASQTALQPWSEWEQTRFTPWSNLSQRRGDIHPEGWETIRETTRHIYTHMRLVTFGHSSIVAPAAQWQVTFRPRGHGGGSTCQTSCWWTISPKGEFWFQVQALQAEQGADRPASEQALLSSQRRVVLLIAVCCHNSAVFTDESCGDGGRHLLWRYLDLLDQAPRALNGQHNSKKRICIAFIWMCNSSVTLRI